MAEAKDNHITGDPALATDINQMAKNANDSGGFRDNINAGETINGGITPVAVYQNTTDNELYACDASDNTKLEFIGFVISNSTDGNPIDFQGEGIVRGFSGLDEGQKYYVQDDKTIATTYGTNIILVGRAISTTELLILKEPYNSSIKILTAGENMTGATTPQPAYIEDGIFREEQTELINQLTVNSQANIFGANWNGQTFTTDADTTRISRISIYFDYKVGTPSGNCTVSIYATSGGQPTGSSLGSVDLIADDIIDNTFNIFKFSSEITVSPSTMYAIVISVSSGDSSNYLKIKQQSSDVYAGGTNIVSTDSGSSWTTNSSIDIGFKVYGGFVGTTGQLYLSDANFLGRQKFDGFVSSTASAGSIVKFHTSGIIRGFSGLSEGQKYYVQDTAGNINDNYGNIVIQVGRAISTTELLIIKKDDNIFPGDIELISLNNNTNILTTSYTKVKDAKIYQRGIVKIKYQIYSGTIGVDILSRIYINDIPIGIENTTPNGNTIEYSEDIRVEPNDNIQIYAKTSTTGGAGSTPYIDYMKICVKQYDGALSILD